MGTQTVLATCICDMYMHENKSKIISSKQSNAGTLTEQSNAGTLTEQSNAGTLTEYSNAGTLTGIYLQTRLMCDPIDHMAYIVSVELPYKLSNRFQMNNIFELSTRC